MQENEIQVRVQQELDKYLSNPYNLIVACQKVIQEQDLQIAELKPKAEVWDIAMGSDSLFEMATVSKILNFKDMGRNQLFEYLRNRNILRYNNEPYQKYVNSCYFKQIEQTITRDGMTFINRKTMVTQKGVDWLAKILLEDGYELNPR